jgi:hypothetical protein
MLKYGRSKHPVRQKFFMSTIAKQQEFKGRVLATSQNCE